MTENGNRLRGTPLPLQLLVYERCRREAPEPVLVIDGAVQRHDHVWSLLATTITPFDAGSGGSPHSRDYR